MELFKKESDKKEATIQSLNATLQEKMQIIQQLEEKSSRIGDSKTKIEAKNI